MQRAKRTATTILIDRDARTAADLASFRHVERRRRVFQRYFADHPLPAWLFIRITCSSFRLEDLVIDEDKAAAALDRHASQRALRPPQFTRIRNHVAILKRIERSIRRGLELRLRDVMGWYASLSSGLSIGSVDGSRAQQLEHHLRRINSPRLRVEPAVREAAAVHIQLLSDPIFPGFNGVLARLLLQFHLGRCHLPPVVFDEEPDRIRPGGEALFSARLVAMILASYASLIPSVK